MLIFGQFWLSPTWYSSVISPVVLKDIEGTVLNIGDRVRLEGFVVGLSPDSPTVGKALINFRYGPLGSISVSTLNLVKE
jgi:hypothetical protein